MDDRPPRTRVSLIAPHSITRAALRILLESTGRFEIAGEGETPPEVMSAQPDVVLIDAPANTDVAALVGAVAAAAHDVAIVVLLDEDNLAQCSAAIEAGAAGLIGRRHSPQALFAAIDRVRGGETSIDRAILYGVIRMTRPRVETPVDRMHTLSKREMEVHALVAQGLKNKEIAQQLFISEATVRHHLTSIFGKLGVSGRLELLAAHWRRTAAPEPVRAGRVIPR
jgi:DNA-binding NarL/FixJ family response regulator